MAPSWLQQIRVLVWLIAVSVYSTKSLTNNRQRRAFLSRASFSSKILLDETSRLHRFASVDPTLEHAPGTPSIVIPPPFTTVDDGYIPPSFVSWEHLLEQKTRSGTKFANLPRFVDLAERHRKMALKWTNGTSDHVQRMLQGGYAAGPIVRNPRTRQVVRLGAALSGLSAAPFPDVTENDAGYLHDDLSWIFELQSHLSVVRDEVRRVLPSIPDSAWESLRTRKGKDWSDATGWSHLALIDNFAANERLVESFFPATFELLLDIVGIDRPRMGPRLCAIARQKAGTGIAEHYDYMNWHWTLHTALSGPESGAGIIVNGTKRDWRVGRPIVVDTTFAHETYNNNHADQDCYLLLVDFWHPDLSPDEIDAMRTFLAMNCGV